MERALLFEYFRIMKPEELQKLKEVFKDRINIIFGDSTVTVPTIEGKFDLIHIDVSRVKDNPFAVATELFDFALSLNPNIKFEKIHYAFFIVF